MFVSCLCPSSLPGIRVFRAKGTQPQRSVLEGLNDVETRTAPGCPVFVSVSSSSRSVRTVPPSVFVSASPSFGFIRENTFNRNSWDPIYLRYGIPS
jgi:hypothetical protein